MVIFGTNKSHMILGFAGTAQISDSRGMFRVLRLDQLAEAKELVFTQINA